jgi:hypothetical protein
MLKVILILVYLYGNATAGPELVVEKKAFASEEDCRIAGGRRTAELTKDPKLVEGYFAACIPAVVTEAKK